MKVICTGFLAFLIYMMTTVAIPAEWDNGDAIRFVTLIAALMFGPILAIMLLWTT